MPYCPTTGWSEYLLPCRKAQRSGFIISFQRFAISCQKKIIKLKVGRCQPKALIYE
jgi:hypothetical protein